MVYWLLIFIWTPEGNLIDRIDLKTDSAEECIELAKSKYDVAGIHDFICVSDDHYEGRKSETMLHIEPHSGVIEFNNH